MRKGASLASRNQVAQFIDTQLGPSDMVGVMYPLETTSSVRMTRNHSAVVRGLQQFEGRKYDYTPKNQMEELYAHYPTETVELIRNQVSLSNAPLAANERPSGEKATFQAYPRSVARTVPLPMSQRSILPGRPNSSQASWKLPWSEV